MLYFIALLYLVAIVVQPAAWIPLLEETPVQEILILLGMIVMVVGHGNRLMKVVASVPSRYFLGFILISILSCLGQGKEYYLGLVGLGLFKVYLSFVLLVVAFDTIEKLRNGLFVMVCSAFVVAYLCIELAQTGVGVGLQVLNWRGSVQWVGSYEGTNTTAQLLLFIIALALGLLFKEKAFFMRLILVGAVLYVGYSFLLTNSRGGFVGLLAILAYFTLIKTKINYKVFIPLAIVSCVLVILLKPQEEGRGIGESSSSERVELLYQGLQMIKREPLLGVGFGQFPRNNPVRKTAHNIYLNVMAETGIIGFAAFFLMFYCAFRELYRIKVSLPEDDILHRTTIPIIFALISIMVTAFFLSSRHDIPYLVLALMVIPSFNQGSKFPISIAEYKYIFISIFFILGVIYALVQLFFVMFR